MKRNLHMEKMSDEMFRPLSTEECQMISGGISRKVTGKVTFGATEIMEADADGEVDVEFDF